MRIRKAKTGETCSCDFGDVMGYRNSDSEHFRGCPFGDSTKPIDAAVYKQRDDLVEEKEPFLSTVALQTLDEVRKVTRLPGFALREEHWEKLNSVLQKLELTLLRISENESK